MHVRTDPDGRIIARRNSAPPSNAPGDWHDIGDTDLTPPDHDPWQRPVAFYDGTDLTWEVVERPPEPEPDGHHSPVGYGWTANGEGGFALSGGSSFDLSTLTRKL